MTLFPFFFFSFFFFTQESVSEHAQFVDPESHQEEITEGNNLAITESPAPKMDYAWVEEQNSPYAYSEYPQSAVPQTASQQNSAIDWFNQFSNDPTDSSQPDGGMQVNY